MSNRLDRLSVKIRKYNKLEGSQTKDEEDLMTILQMKIREILGSLQYTYFSLKDIQH